MLIALQVVFEAPPGVKMNLQRTYSSWSTDFLAGHSSSQAAAAAAGNSSSMQQQLAVAAELVPLRAQLLFLLAWFNAVVQERRNYVPYVSTAPWYVIVICCKASAGVVWKMMLLPRRDMYC
jgi:dynein heavy chain 2